MSETDKIRKRGTLFYVVVLTIIWFLVDYAQQWFFETFDIQSIGFRALIFLIILIAILSVIIIFPRD